MFLTVDGIINCFGMKHLDIFLASHLAFLLFNTNGEFLWEILEKIKWRKKQLAENVIPFSADDCEPFLSNCLMLV